MRLHAYLAISERLTAFHGLSHSGKECIRNGKRSGETLVQDLFETHAQQLLGCRIGITNPQGFIDCQYCSGHRVEQQSVYGVGLGGIIIHTYNLAKYAP